MVSRCLPHSLALLPTRDSESTRCYMTEEVRKTPASGSPFFCFNAWGTFLNSPVSFMNVRPQPVRMAFNSKWWLISIHDFFHFGARQTNKSRDTVLSPHLPASIYDVYLPSLVQGTYYSLKPLSESERGSQWLDKAILSVQWVNRRQGTQTGRPYHLHHFQESEELLHVPFLAVINLSLLSHWL